MKKLLPYAFIAPFFVLFAVFALFPLLFSLYLAFHSWEPTSGLGAMHWVGLDNFAFALRDDWFWKSLRNTGWLAIASGVPQHLVAIPLATFLHIAFKRWRNPMVGAYFLPYITSTVAIAIMFSSLFSTDFGLINLGLQAVSHWPVFGAFLPADPIDWMGQPENIKPAIALIVFWLGVVFSNITVRIMVNRKVCNPLRQVSLLNRLVSFFINPDSFVYMSWS